nr:AAA family ATPase [Yoonia sp.]
MQNTKPVFASGYGQSDTRAPILSDGRPNPHPSAGTPYKSVTGAEVVAMANSPATVAKDKAQWFIPSTYIGCDARTHDVQRTKGTFRWLTLDVDNNNLTLADVNATVSDVIGEAFRLIYSTRSATEDNRKWRVLIPTANAIAGADFSDTQNAFFDLLENASAGALIPDRKLAGPAQLVYLPNRGVFYEYKADKAAMLDLTPEHAIIQHRDAKRVALARAEAEATTARDQRIADRKAKMQSGDVSPVDHFNAAHSVADLLAQYKYAQAGSSRDWRSPMQSSGSYATRDFGNYWVSLSSSDADAGMGAPTSSGNRHGDAFDLYRHFEHGGDFCAAVKAYAQEAALNRQSEGGQHNDNLDDFQIEPRQTSLDVAIRETQMNSFNEGIFIASDLQGQPIPPRVWHVQDLIPSDTVTLFSGDGGTGKSLLALQLAASTALARPWLGLPVREGKAIYLSAEDDRAELHRRLADIAQAEGVLLADLSNLTLRSLAGEDALLALLGKGGALEPTPLLDAIDDLLERFQPDLLVLDTLADYFPGNENDRAEARQFIGMLRGLAIRHRCAVFMLAHPSLTGLNSGTGTSGSTGWNNSVRSRLYLSRVVQDSYEPNPDARVLRTMKSNYARTGAEIGLTWQNGVFIADAPVTGLDRVAASAKAERVFLKLLNEFTEQGRRVNHASGANYAPKLFAENAKSEGCTKRVLKAAMDALLDSGKIAIEQDGPPSKRRTFLAAAGVRHCGSSA